MRRSSSPRILLLRSGRHLRVAMDSLQAHAPGCHIGVVGTAGSEGAIEQAGIAAEDRFVYGKQPRLQPLSFFLSATARRARQWRYDRVAVLWNDPQGRGQGNVDRTALIMSPCGFLAIAPDGSIIERSTWRQCRTEGRRLVASLGAGAALAVLLYAPAAIFRLFATWTGRGPQCGSST